MKFRYEYRNSNNEKLSGEISAASRDAVYSNLRKVGIRPSRVELAPGLLNRVLQFGKRGVLIVVLFLALVLAFFVIRHKDREIKLASEQSAVVGVDSRVRRQVIGDSAIIELGIKTGWADVFSREGDQFLASFAIPGVQAGKRATTEEALLDVLKTEGESPVRENVLADSFEARQVRAMVEGMKDELREFLAAGGTVKQYGRCLVERQESEIGYYNRAKDEIEKLSDSSASERDVLELWKTRNADLRRMGIKLLPMPE